MLCFQALQSRLFLALSSASCNLENKRQPQPISAQEIQHRLTCHLVGKFFKGGTSSFVPRMIGGGEANAPRRWEGRDGKIASPALDHILPIVNLLQRPPSAFFVEEDTPLEAVREAENHHFWFSAETLKGTCAGSGGGKGCAGHLPLKEVAFNGISKPVAH